MASLVTGGAGFLGSHVVDALIARGEHVIIADDLRAGSLRNIDGALSSGRSTFLYIDVDRPFEELWSSVREAAGSAKITQIFHLASAQRLIPSNSESCERASETKLASILRLAIANGSRLILVPPFATEGDFDQPPPEPPKSPSTSAATILVVRLGECYGPRMSLMPENLVGRLLAATSKGEPLSIPGDGLSQHSLTFVDDAVRMLLAFASAAQNQMEPGERIEAESERPSELTAFEIAYAFARAVNVPLDITNPPLQSKAAARSVLPSDKTLTARYASTSLEEGLRKTIRWLRYEATAYA